MNLIRRVKKNNERIAQALEGINRSKFVCDVKIKLLGQIEQAEKMAIFEIASDFFCVKLLFVFVVQNGETRIANF